MSYYGEDDYDYQRQRRRPSPHRYRSDRRTTNLLSPEVDGGGLRRSRSTGHAPVPVINVFNDMQQDGSYRNSSRSPPYSPGSDFRSSDYRGRRLGDDLAEEFVDLAVENRRLRSRSRGRSDAGMLRRDDYLEYELRDRERRIREMERRDDLDREEERLKDKYENQKIRDDAKRRADEDDAKAEKKRIIDDYERKQREESQERKEEEKRLREKIEREKREAKEKEEREWEEFLRKQKEKEEKEKEEKKKKDEEIETEMRRRLSQHGYTYDQIERMIKDKKNDPTAKTTTITTTRSSNYRPTYAKIHRDFLSIDTLTYYDIPYERDPNDRNYYIILREMDRYETDVLFEHTRRLRSGKLLLEPPKKEKEYAWVRKRDRSGSRVKLGILEIKKS